MSELTRQSSRELALRLADVAQVVASARYDEDTGDILGGDDNAGFLSAIDYALRGSPGCMEPDEWQARREEALAARGDYLGLDDG
jgi:hypothetical protein